MQNILSSWSKTKLLQETQKLFFLMQILFSFSLTSGRSKVEEHSLPYYLIRRGGRIVEVILFPRFFGFEPINPAFKCSFYAIWCVWLRKLLGKRILGYLRSSITVSYNVLNVLDKHQKGFKIYFSLPSAREDLTQGQMTWRSDYRRKTLNSNLLNSALKLTLCHILPERGRG